MCQSGSWWGTLRWWYSHFLENWNVKIDANNSNTFSIFSNIHIVWKLLKMSHLNFWNLAFSTNFCPIKTDLSGNTFWPQALVFPKLAKMDHFWYFWLTFVHSKYKHSSLRSQCWMRLLLIFITFLLLQKPPDLATNYALTMRWDAKWRAVQSNVTVKEIIATLQCPTHFHSVLWRAH